VGFYSNRNSNPLYNRSLLNSGILIDFNYLSASVLGLLQSGPIMIGLGATFQTPRINAKESIILEDQWRDLY